jgi:hypothetical protein
MGTIDDTVDKMLKSNGNKPLLIMDTGLTQESNYESVEPWRKLMNVLNMHAQTIQYLPDVKTALRLVEGSETLELGAENSTHITSLAEVLMRADAFVMQPDSRLKDYNVSSGKATRIIFGNPKELPPKYRVADNPRSVLEILFQNDKIAGYFAKDNEFERYCRRTKGISPNIWTFYRENTLQIFARSLIGVTIGGAGGYLLNGPVTGAVLGAVGGLLVGGFNAFELSGEQDKIVKDSLTSFYYQKMQGTNPV